MVYYQVDLAILWFINLVSCCQQLTFALFIYKCAFCPINPEVCYDNYVYENVEFGQIPLFDLHGTTRHKLRTYFQTTEWQDLLLAAKCNRFLANKVVDRIKTTTA